MIHFKTTFAAEQPALFVKKDYPSIVGTEDVSMSSDVRPVKHGNIEVRPLEAIMKDLKSI